MKTARPKGALASFGQAAEYSPSALVRGTACPESGWHGPRLRLTGPIPHVGPRLPLEGNDK
ncbi:hypothetical protein SY2F82_51290 [Streptomyces sp. Y2F8-2]|nr:hypothetical protein SY2F82_51290 [Streptomyces sp. Y2F8-2]